MATTPNYNQATPDQPGLNAHSFDADANLLGKFLASVQHPGSGWLGLASGDTEDEARAKLGTILHDTDLFSVERGYTGARITEQATGSPWAGIEPPKVVWSTIW